jgi:hypothetical protein
MTVKWAAVRLRALMARHLAWLITNPPIVHLYLNNFVNKFLDKRRVGRAKV